MAGITWGAEDISAAIGAVSNQPNRSLYFQAFNRGKKSLALDLRHPEAAGVLHDLVRVSHAVYNNLRGDVPAKLGLTYAALHEVNPAVVCCSLSGFGATGPRAAEPAFDYLIQGYAGWMSITGEPDGPPGKCGVSVVDFSADTLPILLRHGSGRPAVHRFQELAADLLPVRFPFLDLADDGFQPFFELPAILGPGNQESHVEGDDAAVF